MSVWPSFSGLVCRDWALLLNFVPAALRQGKASAACRAGGLMGVGTHSSAQHCPASLSGALLSGAHSGEGQKH